jgi:hypothetical protein
VVLYGRLRVTCDDMHLHYVEPHQFIDSPEWEANHDNSDDVFQVRNSPPTPSPTLTVNRISFSHNNFAVIDPHKIQYNLLTSVASGKVTKFLP